MPSIIQNDTNKTLEIAHGEREHIDQAIYESEKEMAEGGASINLDEAFEKLNKKYYG